jgi:hypothetical protein
MRTMSEVGQKQIDAIESRLQEIADLLEPLYGQVDALCDEASALVRQKNRLWTFESAARGEEGRVIRAECALDPFTVTVRTFGNQRRLTLKSCSKAFYLFRVVPQIVKALAEIGIDMDADEQNISTVSAERWERGIVEAFSIENEAN